MHLNVCAITCTRIPPQQGAHVWEVGKHDRAVSAPPIQGLCGSQAGRAYTCAKFQYRHCITLQKCARWIPCPGIFVHVRQQQVG